MADLDEWLNPEDSIRRSEIQEDSIRRAEDRRAQRRRELARAEALGATPYMYAVERVEKVARTTRRALAAARS